MKKNNKQINNRFEKKDLLSFFVLFDALFQILYYKRLPESAVIV